MSGADGLSHLDAGGRVRMVDTSAKAISARRAEASAVVHVGERVFAALSGGTAPKGDVLTTAQIAGIAAAKRTPELIPLCHSLSPEHIDVRITLTPPDAVRIVAIVAAAGRTGVEMEAMVAASVAALTLYDMCKSIDKGITLGPIRLESKSGGKSGEWRREPGKGEPP